MCVSKGGGAPRGPRPGVWGRARAVGRPQDFGQGSCDLTVTLAAGGGWAEVTLCARRKSNLEACRALSLGPHGGSSDLGQGGLFCKIVGTVYETCRKRLVGSVSRRTHEAFSWAIGHMTKFTPPERVVRRGAAYLRGRPCLFLTSPPRPLSSPPRRLLLFKYPNPFL